jgi:hypothetical protein
VSGGGGGRSTAAGSNQFQGLWLLPLSLATGPGSNKLVREPMSKDSKKRALIAFVESRLKSMCCEDYSFGQRHVFKVKEPEAGSLLLHGTCHYVWPTGHKNTKARDSHPDLNEHFPVPDKKCLLI